MFKKILFGVLTLSAMLALGANYALAQDAAPADPPAQLSLDSLMVPEEPFTIDPELLKLPENANADEIFDFIDSLQDKLPEPKSPQALLTLTDAISKTALEAANRVLAMENLTEEQKERAVQLKVIALTTRAKIDENAGDELNTFAQENIDNAKSTDELIKAYQLKLQILASGEGDTLAAISAFSDELYQKEEPKLKVFALEIKAQVMVSKVQETGEVDEGFVKFISDVADDKAQDVTVREKAYEMKLVALIVKLDIESSKLEDLANPLRPDEEDEGKKDPKEIQKNVDALSADVEALFVQLLGKEYSEELRETIYQLRVQTLLDPNYHLADKDAKIQQSIDMLAQEESAQLFRLYVAFKGQNLLNKANASADAITALEEFANEVYELSKEKPELKNQGIGLKIQAAQLKRDTAGLLAFINQELENNPEDALAANLNRVKFSLVAETISTDPSVFAQYEDYIKSLKNNPDTADVVYQLYVARFTGAVAAAEKNDCNLEEFQAAYAQLKKDLTVEPRAITSVITIKAATDAIGKKNNQEDLYVNTLNDLIEFCKTSDSEELNAIAQNLEVFVKQQVNTEAKEEE